MRMKFSSASPHQEVGHQRHVGIILIHTLLFMSLGVTCLYVISFFALGQIAVSWHLES
ncbi:hypothetical protein H5410_005634 [Solanum commersonii]|uniref:Uncharacterized protein n=1 Tax=Solanum commersonii TaxID=4109 RepID=A0A9J6A7P3_SOLCO|nr:hypothetical protein H5410_005634 [Solanum commersonii]